ncbi:MAG: cytochrome c [bacterium]|nr:cytochrome c [bacterium]
MASNRLRMVWRSLLFPLLACVLLVGCGEGDDGYATADTSDSERAAIVVPELSDVARRGGELFTANCAECHGPTAGGSSEGPPLVDRIYEPGHHADFSFHVAVSQGSPQHHWSFGDMEPVPGLSPEDVDSIVCYVRELQFANGIFSDRAALSACQG